MICESVLLREVLPHINATLIFDRPDPVSATRLRARAPSRQLEEQEELEELDERDVLEVLDDLDVEIDIDVDVELADADVSEPPFLLVRRQPAA